MIWGALLVIQKIGSEVKEEARLFEFPLTGHCLWFGK